MRKITIRRSILPIQPRYIAEWAEVRGVATLRLDYMGQILKTLGHQVYTDKCPKPKLVSDLSVAVHPFTRIVRGCSVQTDITSDIMSMPFSPESERRLVAMLEPFGFEVEFVQ